MFDVKSRYAKLRPYERKDKAGRKVVVVPIPPAPEELPMGRHLMKQGQRIDHLAQLYLSDPAGYWRICEVNGAMFPEQLSERKEIVIPINNRFR